MPVGTTDIVVLSVLGGFVACVVVLFPIYLILVIITGFGSRRVQSICSHILRFGRKPKQWSWTQIEPRLFLGSLPRSISHIDELKAQGVGAIVTLNQDWELALSNYQIRHARIALLHLPTPDFFAPTQEDIWSAVDFISKAIAEGTGVYVHCNGGKGRSAVCVISYLICAHGMTPEAAFDAVRAKRKIASMRGKGGLHKQWRAIKTFAKSVNEPRLKPPLVAFAEPGEEGKSSAGAGGPKVMPAPAEDFRDSQDVGLKAVAIHNVAKAEANSAQKPKDDSTTAPQVDAQAQAQGSAEEPAPASSKLAAASDAQLLE